MPANIAEEISAEKVVALEGSESDLEKYDESAEMSNVEKVVEVGKKGVSCWNCGAQMTPGHQCELQSDKIEVEDEEKRKTERVKVLCDYEAQFWYELTIKKGDLIDLVNDDDNVYNKGWWKGKVGGKEGYFPAAHVEKV